MPFPGNILPASIMASKQGMKDVAFAAVTDQAQPVMQSVNGALTGKGSGLLTPQTVTNGSSAQSSLTRSAQAAGQAMTLGRSTFSPVGSSATYASSPAGAGQAGGAQSMAAQGMGAAQAMMSQSPSQLGSAAAMAGSGLGNAAMSQASSMGSGAAASAASAGGAGMAALPGIAPGMRPAAPQFTPPPAMPSMPRLSDVLSRLGAAAGLPAGAGAGGANALSGAAGSGASAPPPSQFAGSAPADPTEAEFT